MSIYKLRNEVRDLAQRAAASDSKSETHQLLAEHETKLKILKKRCTHKYLIILCSEYSGSYSHDYEDAHGESRQCLVCGTVESAFDERFIVLIGEPIGRFEHGSRYERSQVGDQQGRWSKGDPLQHPLRALIVWVKKYGYAAFTKKWKAEQEVRVQAQLAEEKYQAFKKTHHDRLVKELREELQK